MMNKTEARLRSKLLPEDSESGMLAAIVNLTGPALGASSARGAGGTRIGGTRIGGNKVDES